MPTFEDVRLGAVLQERQERPTDQQLLSGSVPIVSKIRFSTGDISLRQGADTRTGMILAKPGDLLVSGINAHQGAVAVWDNSREHDVAATIHYGAYYPIDNRVNVRYLWYLFRSEVFKSRIREFVPGGIKTELKAKRLLQIPVPLLPVEMQTELVAKLDRIFSILAESVTLAKGKAESLDRLLIAMAHRNDLTDDQKVEAGWKRVRLGEVMQLDLDPVKVDPSNEYPNLGIYSFGKGLFHKPPISGLETSATVLYRVGTGQFIYSRLFAFEGSYGYVSEDFDGKYVSGEYPTFTCNPQLCRAEFVYAHFKLKSVWHSLSGSSKGLGLRRQRVQAPAILAHEVWLPPLKVQDRIAEVLRSKQQYDALNTFEKDAEALRRSILAKAFRGEL